MYQIQLTVVPNTLLSEKKTLASGSHLEGKKAEKWRLCPGLREEEQVFIAKLISGMDRGRQTAQFPQRKERKKL